MWLESLLALAALTAAAATRPWRLLASRKPLVHESHGAASPLWTPLLATLVFLPWMWALPTLHAMPLQLQWSGACLVVLMLGWPLAIPVLLAVGAIAGLLSPALDWADALAGLHALAHGLRASGGFSASRDYLETALSAYHRALDVEPGRVIPDVRS